MKKPLFILPALLLAFSLAIPLAAPVAAAVPVTVDFEGLTPGVSVEGLGAVHADLNIQSTGNAVAIAVGEDPAIYGAPNGGASQKNGGLNGQGGFGDTLKQHDYEFTFSPGITVNEFSITMLDYGDYNPTQAEYHEVKLVAYDECMNELDTDVLSFYSSSQINPTSSDYGNLYYTGDAVDAGAGSEPGNWTFTVSADHIAKVELIPVAGLDPNIGFDDIEFAIEEKSITLTKEADFPGDRADLGETINYTFEVYNDGDVYLYDVSVMDPLLDADAVYDYGDDNDDELLNPGESWYFIGSHVVTEDDILSCMLDNTATAEAWWCEGPNDYVTATASVSVPVAKMVNIWAGKYTDVGEVEIWNDGANLNLAYRITEDDWTFTETHLYVGKNEPLSNIPGQFPYDCSDAEFSSDTQITFQIPLDCIDSYSLKTNKKGKSTGVMVADGNPGVSAGDQIYIAIHNVVQKDDDCVVVQEETSWGGWGDDFENIIYFEESNWSNYIEFFVMACQGNGGGQDPF